MKQDFEHLMRPWLGAPPRNGQRLSIPELWEKAKALFAGLIETLGGEERVRAPRRIGRSERAEILGWLEPVEKLTRALLCWSAPSPTS